jgi:hypothetical protein
MSVSFPSLLALPSLQRLNQLVTKHIMKENRKGAETKMINRVHHEDQVTVALGRRKDGFRKTR